MTKLSDSNPVDTPELIAQVFAAGKRPISDITGLTTALSAWFLRWPEHNFLHPCVIDGLPALVCRRDLSSLASDAFGELQGIAEQYGIFLKQDSRIKESECATAERRRSAAVVLTFCLGLLATTRAVTAAEFYASGAPASVASRMESPSSGMQASQVIGSDGQPVIRLRQVRPPSAAQVMESYQSTASHDISDAGVAAGINDFLRQVYQAQAGDPATIADDLAVMANYYAQYPAVLELINALRGQKLVLKYRKDTWQTQAWGNEYMVDSATISFDTRLGAQLLNAPGCDNNPACGISPADALLHELLHAKLMLLDSKHFIEAGGMAPNLYPFEHEHEVIREENQLYHVMNVQDSHMRPLRHRHVGTLLQVSCPACAPGQSIVADAR